MTVVAPGDPVEARLATRAIAEHPGPCYLRSGKGRRAGGPCRPRPTFELGRAIRVREGGDLTLISTGGMLKPARRTADQLRRAGHPGPRAEHAHGQAASTPRPSRSRGGNARDRHARRTQRARAASVRPWPTCWPNTTATARDFASSAYPTVYHEVGSQAYMRGLAGDPAEMVAQPVETASRCLDPRLENMECRMKKELISVVTPCYNEEAQHPRRARGREAGLRERLPATTTNISSATTPRRTAPRPCCARWPPNDPHVKMIV